LARLGRAKQLGEFFLFEGLEPEALQDLEAFAQTRVVEKGQAPFFPDDRARSVYFVASGRVKISRLSVEGKEFILDFIEPGQVFGEAGIFDGGPREANAQTMERSTLVSVPSERLRSFLAQRPVILMRFAEMLGSRQKKLEKRLVDVAHKNAPRRLAELLVQLSQSYGVRDARGTLLRIKLSQSALGNLLGVSREIVNHAVSDLRRRGVIDVADGRVIIQNPEALALAAL
jgi:CRP/FNR family transcriptional regulator